MVSYMLYDPWGTKMLYFNKWIDDLQKEYFMHPHGYPQVFHRMQSATAGDMNHDAGQLTALATSTSAYRWGCSCVVSCGCICQRSTIRLSASRLRSYLQVSGNLKT